MQRKRLSADSRTFVLKFIFPASCIVVLGITCIRLLFQDNTKEQYVDIVTGIIYCTIVLFVFLRLGVTLKKVSIDGSELVISNYFKKIRVPLSQIHSVSTGSFFSPMLIWITFKPPTAFGSKIKFMPRIANFYCYLDSRSVVKELRELAGIDNYYPDS